MRILGIDPGLHVCGYAVLDNDENQMSLIEAGIFKTDRKKIMPLRLDQIAKDISSIIEDLSLMSLLSKNCTRIINIPELQY